MVDLMKIEDPFSPPGDQPDLNKLRRTKQPTPVLGRNLYCEFLQPGLLLSGRRRRTPVLAAIWTRPSSPNGASFIGAAGWMSEGWGLGWKEVSCRWGPGGHVGRAVGWRGRCPLSPVPRCFPPSGCSAVLGTQSGRSGTPGERRQDSMSDRSVSHPGAAPGRDAVQSSSGGLPHGSRKTAFPLPLPPVQTPGTNWKVVNMFQFVRIKVNGRMVEKLQAAGFSSWIPTKRSHWITLLSQELFFLN